MYASHGVPMEPSTDGRGKKFAITIAERQWTKRVRRSNNSSIVIDVRGLRDKDRPTFSEMFRNGTSFQQILKSVEKELGAETPRTPVGAIRDSIGTRCRILLQRDECIKLGTINGPTEIVRSFLNVPQDIFELVMPRALDAGLKSGPPILATPSS